MEQGEGKGDEKIWVAAASRKVVDGYAHENTDMVQLSK
jgi:hypothetical protein